jgi:purine nucleoside phosphorylase
MKYKPNWLGSLTQEYAKGMIMLMDDFLRTSESHLYDKKKEAEKP